MYRGIGMVSLMPCVAAAGVKSGRLPDTVGVPAVQLGALALGGAVGSAVGAAVGAGTAGAAVGAAWS
jgi:hypothetical protein